jgi:DNA-binding transcriptional MocR family regulator
MSTLPPLREREKKILFLIRMWQWKYGYSPSIQKVGELFGVERSTIAQVYQKLCKKGYIEMTNHKSWQHRVVRFPRSTTFNWGNDPTLPDELFDHMRPENYNKRNGIDVANTV